MPVEFLTSGQVVAGGGTSAQAAATSATEAAASATAAASSATSAAASSAAAGTASGRLEISEFSQLASVFVYSGATGGQQNVAEGDVVHWAEAGVTYTVAASGATDADFDYTGTGGVKIYNNQSVAQQYLSTVALGQLQTSPHTGYADLLPTSTNPVAAVRMDTDWIMVRTRTANLADAQPSDDYFDEFIFRNADGTFPPEDPVLGGWQLWSHRTFASDKVTSWIISPTDQGGIPNADFAFRVGDSNDTYVSGGEGPDWFYRGFGHGGMFNVPADNQIFLSGSAATNYNSVANWPIGTRLYGTSLQINEVFYLHHPAFAGTAQNITNITQANPAVVTVTGHGLSTGERVKIQSVVGMTEVNFKTFTVTAIDANTFSIGVDSTGYTAYSSAGTATEMTDVAEINYTRVLDTRGLIMEGDIEALVADVGFNDSYTAMFPVLPYQANVFKPQDTASVAITRDGVQKPTDNSWAGSGFDETIFQAYSVQEPTLVRTLTLPYGQPLRQQGGGLAAWGLNDFGRAFFSDFADFPKLYVFGASSEESAPRTAHALPTGTVYEWQNRVETFYRATGAI